MRCSRYSRWGAVLIIVLGLLGAGCAKNIRTVTEKVDPKTKQVTERVITTDYTDATRFHQNQVQMAKLAHPISEVSFPKGGTVPPGMKIVTWGPNGRFMMKQFEELSVKLVRQLKGALMQAITLGILTSNSGDDGSTTYNGDITNTNGNMNVGNGALTGGVSTSTVSGEGNSGSSGAASPSVSESSSESSQDTLGFGF